MAQAVVEIPEVEAEGKIKDIYEDIKATLRVPVVNLIFRTLATDPDYLQVAWTALKPNAQTAYFEHQADALRTLAVDAGQGPVRPLPAPPPDASESLKVFHYVNPKLLLAVVAIRAATNGQQPRLMELSRDQKRQIEPGVPATAPQISMLDPETADTRLQEVFDQIKSETGLPFINSDYRALARWPDYLEQAWGTLQGTSGTQQYRDTRRRLQREAEAAILGLPFRMDIAPHALRQAGLSEQRIDRVRAVLDQFAALLPGLILNIAILSIAAWEHDQARLSPYPVTML